MITHNKTTAEPRLKITYDQFADSPRDWSTIGIFLTVDSRHRSPDQNEQWLNIVKNTGNCATSQENHIDLIKQELTELGHKVILIVPIVKYEHSGISYSVGSKRGFDYSNNGFYIVTEEGLNELGVENDEEKIIEVIDGELETYNQWCNGEVYAFELLDENGEHEDSCSGFYSIEEIRDYLPEEWENEDLEQYLNY